MTDKEIEFGRVEESGVSGMDASAFVDQYIQGHEKVELSDEVHYELEQPRTEFEGGENGTLEYQAGDLTVNISYEKFHFAESGSDEKPKGMAGFLSPEIAGYGLSPEQLNNLYYLTSAILKPADGEAADLLADARFSKIIFSGSDLGISSRYNPISKLLFISKNPCSIRGLLNFMHEVGHNVDLQDKDKNARLGGALLSLKQGRRSPEALMASVMAEVEASNRTYQELRQISRDEEFLALAKASLTESLSKHIVSLQKRTRPEGLDNMSG